MITLEINFLAVIAATVAHQVLGLLWYGPLFGKTWLAAIGKRMEDLGNPTPALIMAMISALVMAIALALLLSAVRPVDVVKGVTFGALAGIGFVATTSITSGGYEDRPRMVTWLFIAYEVIGLLIMGAILGAWR